MKIIAFLLFLGDSNVSKVLHDHYTYEKILAV